VEHPPFDGAALEHVSLGRFELIQARGQQRLDRRRDLDLRASGVPYEGEHLLDEERITLGCHADPVA